MIKIEILNPCNIYSKESVDPLKEFDPITVALRRFMRENNHKVNLSQGELFRDIAFDPDMICFVEAYPGDFFRALTAEEITVDITDWPILLFIKKIETKFECRFDFSKTSDLLTENELKKLLWGTVEIIANMAREKGYLNEEQVKLFLTGKWW